MGFGLASSLAMLSLIMQNLLILYPPLTSTPYWENYKISKL
jgi:hypothetical protein